MADQIESKDTVPDEKPVVEDVPSSQEVRSSGADEDNGIVTMLDVLEEQEELEENADAVLGGSDEKNCTYIMGYLQRQALYSCKTCIEIDPASKKGGICLACSYHCHEGHELYELYTKRNFRCDCGIPAKFPKTKCTFYADKKGANEDNSYNQNFEGTYCTCKRPYPDPENDNEDQMIQCVICEDWFHGVHLGSNIPDNDDYSEMICGGCMEGLPFLWSYYSGILQESKRLKTEDGDKTELPKEAEVDSGLENSADSFKTDGKCKLGALPSRVCRGPTFWDDGWRQQLCTCSSCTALYAEKKCSYLLDETDTCHHYEREAKSRNTSSSSLERGLSAMNSTMPRTQQIEVIHGYNSLKSALSEYLKAFADSGKVVSEADIQKFFEDFKKNQQPVFVPPSCR